MVGDADIHKQLVDYLKQEIKRGRQAEELEEELLGAGHKKHHVRKACNHVLVHPHRQRAYLFMGLFIVALFIVFVLSGSLMMDDGMCEPEIVYIEPSVFCVNQIEETLRVEGNEAAIYVQDGIVRPRYIFMAADQVVKLTFVSLDDETHVGYLQDLQNPDNPAINASIPIPSTGNVTLEVGPLGAGEYRYFVDALRGSAAGVLVFT